MDEAMRRCDEFGFNLSRYRKRRACENSAAPRPLCDQLGGNFRAVEAPPSVQLPARRARSVGIVAKAGAVSIAFTKDALSSSPSRTTERRPRARRCPAECRGRAASASDFLYQGLDVSVRQPIDVQTWVSSVQAPNPTERLPAGGAPRTSEPRIACLVDKLAA